MASYFEAADNLLYLLAEVYGKHTEDKGLVTSLANISSIFALPNPQKGLETLTLIASRDLKVPDHIELPTDYILLTNFSVDATLGFIFFYRGETKWALKFLEKASGIYPQPKITQPIFDNPYEAQRTVTESKGDLNTLRANYGYLSLDLFLLEAFDKVASKLKISAFGYDT